MIISLRLGQIPFTAGHLYACAANSSLFLLLTYLLEYIIWCQKSDNFLGNIYLTATLAKISQEKIMFKPCLGSQHRQQVSVVSCVADVTAWAECASKQDDFLCQE